MKHTNVLLFVVAMTCPWSPPGKAVTEINRGQLLQNMSYILPRLKSAPQKLLFCDPGIQSESSLKHPESDFPS